MYLSWMFGLSSILLILTSLCMPSSADPASFRPTEGIFNLEIKQKPPSPLLHDFLIRETRPISKRKPANTISHYDWGTGWVSSSDTYFALLPVLPSAARLSIFYAHILLHATKFPLGMVASESIVYNGLPGQILRFKFGGLELKFFSTNTPISWDFVATVATRLRASTGLGYTGLHGTSFVHRATGLVVFVTLTATGVPTPWALPI